MASRNPVRFVAPLVLLAVFIGVFAVVQASRSDSGGSPSTTAAVDKSERVRGRRKAKRRTYVVKAGDTLTLISERTRVPIERIQALNPDVDASSLSVGQRLRLNR